MSSQTISMATSQPLPVHPLWQVHCHPSEKCRHSPCVWHPLGQPSKKIHILNKQLFQSTLHKLLKLMGKQFKQMWTRYDYNLTIMKSLKPAIDTIYPHIKFWWYRTMLNFYPPFLCHVLAAILKMADILKILKTQNCSSNGDLSLCQIICLYHYPVRSYQH
jgi:hypothetical protein